MIEDNQIWADEKAYLKKVVGEIESQIELGLAAADNYKKDAIELQKSMWEDMRIAPTSLFDLEDAAQINQIQMDLANKARIYRFSYEKVSRLERMRKSPYFGRIDFQEKGESKAEKIYIGLYNVSAAGTMEALVYDWRAPVSAMFYDFETGPSAYTCPAGRIEGEMLLKRQYRIENGQIVYMFDSSLNINDAMLQELLGKSTDNRMKTIVTSIQKEQNTVIRNSKDRILIVEGPAGSGKTSIALHRAAYLLYRYRDTISSENILIFSPNHVFEDYIAQVLPELGEENIRRSTFMDFFDKAFLTGRPLETVNQQMEYILTSQGPGDMRLGCIRFKSSAVFLAALKRYVRFLEDGRGIVFKDFVYDRTLLISADDTRRIYEDQYHRLPYANRLEKISQRLLSLLEDYETARIKAAPKADTAAREAMKAEYERVKADMLQMTSVDVPALYAALLNDIGSFMGAADEQQRETARVCAAYTNREGGGMVPYEDFAPLVYLQCVLTGESPAASIQHVIIDEAQDYTAVQYELFKTVFKNGNMTILGDVNQTVNGYMNVGTFDSISEAFGKGSRRIMLTKSYRSSKELADFCNSLLVEPSRSEQLDRHGAKPRLITVSAQELHTRLTDDIKALKAKGYKLIAVICKTAAECRAVHQAVGKDMDIGLISNQNEVYYGDVVVIPSYLAKGLEFDAVLVCPADEKDYAAPEDRKLLYTVCTRALHELYLYTMGAVSPFIAGVEERLYTVE